MRVQKLLKRAGVVPIILIVFLVVLRAFLPMIVKRYVNHTLAKIPGYRGEIAGIKIHLWRGAYEIDGLDLVKVDGSVPIPFFRVKKADLSVQWRELFHRSFVGKIKLVEPQLNFVGGTTAANSQTSIDESWQDRVQELFPLDINWLGVSDGSIHFRNFQANPQVDIYMDQLQLEAQNLSNSRRKYDALLASVKADGVLMRSGHFNLTATFNPFTEQPTFDLIAKADHVDLTTLADFGRHYGGIVIDKGTLDFYSECAAKDGQFRGYVKPFLKDLHVANLNKPDLTLGQKIKGLFAELLAKIFKNRQTQTDASKIEFEGKFDRPKVRTLAAVGFAFRHAFIESLKPNFDKRIGLENVTH